MHTRVKILLVQIVLFMCCFGTSVRAQSESQLNNHYRNLIIDYIRQDIATREKAMTKEAEKLLVSLPNSEKLYDESYITLKTDLAEGTDEDGNPEVNFVYELSYNCRSIEGASDDYREGLYRWNNSNSCKAICNLTKKFLDQNCRDFVRDGKQVTVRINSSTDAKEIKKLDYLGEYGDFRYCPATYNDEPVRISVSKASGITTNAQLAYLRGQSLKSYLEEYVECLKGTENKFEFHTRTAATQGSFYRRSSVQIVVHKAFDELIEAMTIKLKDDGYVDFNIPTTTPNSNPNTYVLIIANEQYPAPFPTVQYAANDANVFQQYCISTLGIPERHTKILADAGRQEIKDLGVEWLKDIARAQKGEVKFIIYYAGHGFTDENYTPYIIPNGVRTEKIRHFDVKIDCDLPLSKGDAKKVIAQSLSLDTLCNWFNRVPNQGITILLDASFNGYQRNGQPFIQTNKESEKMRGMRIRNDIVILSAAQFNKPAYLYDEQHHGFFTYYLLKELRHNKGDIDYETLFNNMSKGISYESSLQNKLQEPAVILGGKAKDSWGVRKFK